MLASSNVPTKHSHTLLHLSLIPMFSKASHYMLGQAEWPTAAIWASCVIPTTIRSCRISLGQMCAFRLPAQGSEPIMIWEPSPTFQASPLFIMSKEWEMTFQMLKAPWMLWTRLRIQSNINMGWMYFLYMMSLHKLFVVMICHPIFAPRAFAKSRGSFSPHPPHFLGFAILSHLTQANVFLAFWPCQRNL